MQIFIKIIFCTTFCGTISDMGRLELIWHNLKKFVYEKNTMDKIWKYIKNDVKNLTNFHDLQPTHFIYS